MSAPPQTAPGGDRLALGKQRCARHAGREAAARCPDCGLVFCRECVTAHEGRFLCASCLGKVVVAARAGRANRAAGGIPAAVVAAGRRALATAAGIAWLWLCFYLAGLLIEKFPRSVHEGTIWRAALAGETEVAR